MFRMKIEIFYLGQKTFSGNENGPVSREKTSAQKMLRHKAHDFRTFM